MHPSGKRSNSRRLSCQLCPGPPLQGISLDGAFQFVCIGEVVRFFNNAEEAHYQFSLQAVEFFKKLNYGDGFVLDLTMDLSSYTYEKLKEYSVVVMLDGYPNTKAERDAFEKYMENGGGWVGFHVAAYNDKNTQWPWFVNFLGVLSVGVAVFLGNIINKL